VIIRGRAVSEEVADDELVDELEIDKSNVILD